MPMPAAVAFTTAKQTQAGLMATGQIGKALGEQLAGLATMSHELPQ